MTSQLRVFAKVLQWTARGLGGLILAYVLLHLVVEGLPQMEGVKLGESLLWAGFCLSVIGFAALWRWRLLGGLVSLAGIVLFYVMNFAISGQFPGGWVLPLFFLPGLFAIVSWLLDRHSSYALK